MIRKFWKKTSSDFMVDNIDLTKIPVDYLLKPGETAIVRVSEGDNIINLNVKTESEAFYEILIASGVPTGYDLILYPNSTRYSSQFTYRWDTTGGAGNGTSGGFLLYRKITSSVPILMYVDISEKHITAIGTGGFLVSCSSKWDNNTDSWNSLGQLQSVGGTFSKGEIIIRRLK